MPGSCTEQNYTLHKTTLGYGYAKGKGCTVSVKPPACRLTNPNLNPSHHAALKILKRQGLHGSCLLPLEGEEQTAGTHPTQVHPGIFEEVPGFRLQESIQGRVDTTGCCPQ